MNPQQPPRPVGLAPVVVDYGFSGIIQGDKAAVHASGDVDILGVHEKTLVEKPHLPQRLGAEEHETSLMVGHVEFSVVIKGLEQIAVVAFSNP